MGDPDITASAKQAEQTVHDVILQLLDDDLSIDQAVKDSVLDALAEFIDGEHEHDEHNWAPTFLASLSVMGFRGIGRQATLDLYPGPGLMVVSGRNGSGKSSFAEALELALTGTSYRWHKKETLWAETWQNLHDHDPCAIRVNLTSEGVGPFAIGMDWSPGAKLVDRSSWTQSGGAKRIDGTAHLRWSEALELWRPVLSYDELGRLFDGGPSALYDALAKLLGLDDLADAEKLLAAQLKSTKAARDDADDERKRLLAVLTESDDDRAQQAAALLRKKGAPLDEALALATGSAGLQVTHTLRELTQLNTPTLNEIEEVVSNLRSASKAVAAAATTVAEDTSQRVDLLRAALQFHGHASDSACPVCGEGTLDEAWATRTREAIAKTEDALSDYRSASAKLSPARVAASKLLADIRTAEAVPDVPLAHLDTYNDAVLAAQQLPEGDEAVAAHLELTLLTVAESAEVLRTQAAEALKSRESSWAPLAAQLGGWVPLEERARELDSTIKTMTAAKKWMADHAGQFRNLRLQPVAAHARRIWSQLRQESNVDLGEITLQGTATRRRAVLSGEVDGKPTKALSVMSQGELHALALALFLPRATAVDSPFRFVVLDDPIQAMDPAKIDGFVNVLSEIAQTHQVIVFSHDDRLASVIRETGVDARLVEVVREAGSKVTVRDNVNPALRQVNDIFALIKDDKLPDSVRARVMPGLFRVAVESAAKQAYFTKQALAGSPRAEYEQSWMSAKKTMARLALAVHGDPYADLKGWLDAKPGCRGAVRLCNAVHHEATGIGLHEARDLERTVHAVLALR
jgi:recombinational DNA repair ATPase RecF